MKKVAFVRCPFLPCSHREDWGLEDPTGKCDEEFIKTIQVIENKILCLREFLRSKEEQSKIGAQ